FTISGTPTSIVGSPFNYTVTTTGGSCAVVFLSGTITVNPASTIALTTGVPVQTICTGTAVAPSISYTVGGGATGATLTGTLPAGVTGSFAGSVFTISGTPTSIVGSPFNYTVTTTGGSCAAVSLSGTITVNPASTIALTTGVPVQTICTGTAIAPSITYTVGGGATGATLTGTLPPGVTGSFAGSVFTISGTPTSAVGSPFNYTVTTTGGSCAVVFLSGTITVNPASTIVLTTGTPVQTICTGTAVAPSISYTVGGGATGATLTGTLPAGVTGSFAGSVFTISGTPTSIVGSPFNYTVTTTGGSCAAVSLSGTITVNPASTIALTTGVPVQTICTGTAIAPSIKYTVGGGATGAALTGTLPAGVTGSFAAGVFTISGTPTS